MKKYLVCTHLWMFSLVGFLGTMAWAAEPTAEELLKASDRARGGVQEGLRWQSEITTFEDGEQSVREFVIKTKGVDVLAEATSPLRTKGEVYVFNDRNMWFVKPGLKKPVSISSRAKLTGLASNGDIASTWYARDYSGKIEKTEVWNGEKHYVLFLKAKSNETTYDQIRYWVNAKNRLASKAEFLTLQGEPLKTATFKYLEQLKIGSRGEAFVSEMEIRDAKRTDYRSVIKYSNLKVSQYKTGEFNINNIRR